MLRSACHTFLLVLFCCATLLAGAAAWAQMPELAPKQAPQQAASHEKASHVMANSHCADAAQQVQAAVSAQGQCDNAALCLEYCLLHCLPAVPVTALIGADDWRSTRQAAPAAALRSIAHPPPAPPPRSLRA